MTVRYVRAFGRFWYDFLVGDRWELFVGPLVALAVAWSLVRADVAPVVVGGILFVLITGVAGVSIVRTLVR